MFAEPVRTNERAIARNKLTILPCSINVLSSRTRAYVVTPRRLREREIGDSRVEIVTQSERKFFGVEPDDVLGQLLIHSHWPGAGRDAARQQVAKLNQERL